MLLCQGQCLEHLLGLEAAEPHEYPVASVSLLEETPGRYFIPTSFVRNLHLNASSSGHLASLLMSARSTSSGVLLAWPRARWALPQRGGSGHGVFALMPFTTCKSRTEALVTGRSLLAKIKDFFSHR